MSQSESKASSCFTKLSINVGIPSFALAIYTTFFLMGLWGCLLIYNVYAYSESPFHFAGRQLIWLILGLAVAVVSAGIPFKWYEDHAAVLALAAYTALLLLIPFGTNLNGMRGWFNFKYCMAQPSELAKPVFILSLCAIATRRKFLGHLFPALSTAVALWITPIVFQPDFGTTLLYLCGFLLVYLLAGGELTSLLFLLPVLAIAGCVVYFNEPYVAFRIDSFFSGAGGSSSNWQSQQFLRAISGGGISGSDWGNSIWSNNYLPLAHSDSSFAALTEIVGFVGAAPVILGYCAIAYVGFRISRGFEQSIQGIFIQAVATLTAVQGLLHISVNVGLLPPTGVTLPMLSYGGSSLVSTALCLGMMLSAAKYGAAASREKSNHILETKPNNSNPQKDHGQGKGVSK